MPNKSMLRARLAAANLTQAGAAHCLGISSNTMSAKMNGRFPFNAREIVAFCALLGITDDAEKVNIFLCSPSQMRDEHTNVCNQTKGA